jgi:hypothetical protein
MKKIISILLLSILYQTEINAQGNVYLIIGSDTAIWDGMNVAQYNCYYNYNVIPDNTKNFYEVMQLSYRNKFSDSFGNKLKLTWWLMTGNIFRYATNKNVPFANMIVPYQSKKYYGTLFTQFGDELTLHYHTFAWTDYDGDRKYYWNQAKEFKECQDDFYYTLAQMLLEEEIFPVSFRSGWNHMSNEWQAELDKLLPYSMHNEAPAYRTDIIEPIDNVYDWRLATQEFIPYRPSPQNYQLNGNGKGWNLHSKYVGSVSQSLMNSIFNKAKTVDQVVCLWGHVWDDLFPEYVLRIDSLAKVSASLNPNVKFKYCTAVEGMQLWRKINDTNPPYTEIHELILGDEVKYEVQTDEPIFQNQPFVSLKFIDETYRVVDFSKTGNNEWTSLISYDKKKIVKVGLAISDTLGNQTKKFLKYLPDDIYIDNSDPGYSEINGTWQTEQKASWGLNSRKSILQANDSSKVRWNFTIPSSRFYNVFIQIPKQDAAAKNIIFKVYNNSQLIETISFSNSIATIDWVYLTTKHFEQSPNNYIDMVAKGTGQASSILAADVIKISPLVRNKWLTTPSNMIDLGTIVVRDTVKYNLQLSNFGIENLSITKIESTNNFLKVNISLPKTISKFDNLFFPVAFYSNSLGKKSDTLIIHTDDSLNPIYKIIFNAEVANYFKLVDNEETIFYKEYGNWATSNAQANGNSSRYAFLNQSPKAYAVFSTQLRESGNYDIYFIVPQTTNASSNALFVIKQGNQKIDSLYFDQNSGSGSWIKIKNASLSSTEPVTIKIADDGKSTSGTVLRADAVKFNLISATSINENIAQQPDKFELEQNYPNPFNPTTVIRYKVQAASYVTLKVYDVLGREVATLVNEFKTPGSYNSQFSSASSRLNSQLPSGVYFYQLRVGNSSTGSGQSFIETKRMLLIK